MAPVLRVQRVSKAFRIPSERRDTVREHIIGTFRPRAFETLHALQDVSFTLGEHETLGIMGPNGSGKSTLLKIVAGVYLPDSGTVDATMPLTPILELGVGWNPELDAVDNILLIGSVMGMPLGDIRAGLREILAFADVERFAHLELKHYSSGMAARLAYAVAFHAVTGILVLDEIFAVGDAGFRQRCEDRFEAMRAAGHPSIIVSHDPATIERFTDRALLLDRGQIVCDGPPEDVAIQYLKATRAVSVAIHPPRSCEAAVLLYTRIGDPPTDAFELSISADALRAQMAHVRNQYTPMPLDDLVEALGANDVPHGAVAITFDDGYVDNLTTAAPILQEFGIPATFFLTTDRLDDDYEYWWDLLERSMFAPDGMKPGRLRIDLPSGEHTFDTSTDTALQQSFWTIYREIVDCDPRARGAVVESVARWSGTDTKPCIRNLRMKTSEVVELARLGGFSIGAHTVRHLRLPALSGADQVSEIEDSRRTLAELTGQPIRAFAYPNGAASERTIQAVRDAGFTIAVTAAAGSISQHTDRLALPRLSVTKTIGPSFGEWLRQRTTAGAAFGS